MELNTFLEKHPEYENDKYKVQAMLLANATESFVLDRVKPSVKISGAVAMDFTCPNCSGQMAQVSINKDRKALFCKMDRVCLPIAV